MDFAYYQHGILRIKIYGIHAGDTVVIAPPQATGSVATELKIWVPGAPLPATSTWITVTP
jgi:hypothetical protein